MTCDLKLVINKARKSSIKSVFGTLFYLSKVNRKCLCKQLKDRI